MPNKPGAKHAHFGLLIAALVTSAGCAHTGGRPSCDDLDKADHKHPSFYSDNPSYNDPTEDSTSWKLSSPSSQGVNQTLLKQAASALSKRPEQLSFIVARNNTPVFERYFHGATETSSNNVHSASKSILSAAIGVAIQEGLISDVDQPVAALLPKKYKSLLVGKMKEWTLRQLLTMTSGLNWIEDSSENIVQTSPDWTQAILDLGLAAQPGSTFNYSTALTHLMSVILTNTTHTSTCEYVRTRVLDRIGVNPTRWDRDPQGYYSGGYNLYLTARGLARFGLLMLAEGSHAGKQIVSKDWIKQATAHHADDSGGYSYGFNWWLKTINRHSVKIAWGFGGQFIYLVPDLSLMAVMTTNTQDFSSVDTGESILKDYLIPASESPTSSLLTHR